MGQHGPNFTQLAVFFAVVCRSHAEDRLTVNLNLYWPPQYPSTVTLYGGNEIFSLPPAVLALDVSE